MPDYSQWDALINIFVPDKDAAPGAPGRIPTASEVMAPTWVYGFNMLKVPHISKDKSHWYRYTTKVGFTTQDAYAGFDPYPAVRDNGEADSGGAWWRYYQGSLMAINALNGGGTEVASPRSFDESRLQVAAVSEYFEKWAPNVNTWDKALPHDGWEGLAASGFGDIIGRISLAYGNIQEIVSGKGPNGGYIAAVENAQQSLRVARNAAAEAFSKWGSSNYSPEKAGQAVYRRMSVVPEPDGTGIVSLDSTEIGPAGNPATWLAIDSEIKKTWYADVESNLNSVVPGIVSALTDGYTRSQMMLIPLNNVIQTALGGRPGSAQSIDDILNKKGGGGAKGGNFDGLGGGGGSEGGGAKGGAGGANFDGLGGEGGGAEGGGGPGGAEIDPSNFDNLGAQGGLGGEGAGGEGAGGANAGSFDGLDGLGGEGAGGEGAGGEGAGGANAGSFDGLDGLGGEGAGGEGAGGEGAGGANAGSFDGLDGLGGGAEGAGGGAGMPGGGAGVPGGGDFDPGNFNSLGVPGGLGGGSGAGDGNSFGSLGPGGELGGSGPGSPGGSSFAGLLPPGSGLGGSNGTGGTNGLPNSGGGKTNDGAGGILPPGKPVDFPSLDDLINHPGKGDEFQSLTPRPNEGADGPPFESTGHNSDHYDAAFPQGGEPLYPGSPSYEELGFESLSSTGQVGAGGESYSFGQEGLASSGTQTATGSTGSGQSAATASGASGASGANGQTPFMPPMMGGMGGMGGGMGGGGGENNKERERSVWLSEDSAVWGTDPALAPTVVGSSTPQQTAPGGTREQQSTAGVPGRGPVANGRGTRAGRPGTGGAVGNQRDGHVQGSPGNRHG